MQMQNIQFMIHAVTEILLPVLILTISVIVVLHRRMKFHPNPTTCGRVMMSIFQGSGHDIGNLFSASVSATSFI